MTSLKELLVHVKSDKYRIENEISTFVSAKLLELEELTGADITSINVNFDKIAKGTGETYCYAANTKIWISI